MKSNRYYQSQQIFDEEQSATIKLKYPSSTAPDRGIIGELSDEQIEVILIGLRILRKIEPKIRICWLANKLGNMSTRQIAKEIGISHKNVAKHVRNTEEYIKSLIRRPENEKTERKVN